MHFCFALDDPVIFAGSLYERSKFIDAEKNCVIRSVHENFCGAIRDPSEELVEVWDDADIRQKIEARRGFAFGESEVGNVRAQNHGTGAAASE